jgi:ribonuclease J
MHKLRVIPLGGAGEIGKNMTLVEYNRHALVIDAGLMFPAGDHLGVDYIIPDMAYIMNHRDQLTFHGIFITHGHEDHIGAIKHALDVIDVPIYATPLTMGLIKNKLKEAKKTNTKSYIIRPGDVVKKGPFSIEAFHVTHSIPDCVGFAIRTPVGMIVHTGDYKFDHAPVDGKPTDFSRIASLGDEGVLALFADSTNADRPGWTPSETVIDEAFEQAFTEAPGRIMVATFASLISRVAQVAKAAQKHRRKMAIVGTSMSANVGMAFELGYLNFPRDLIVTVEEALKLPKHKVVFLITGSQGEPSAVLSRLAMGKHNMIEIQAGDTVIVSAHPIPGNEENVHRIINKLFQNGANVVYDSIAKVHVSGHASQEEMKLMLSLVRPQFFVPLHGELRHFQSHARLAQQLGIPAQNCAIVENGTILEFSPKSMHIKERYPGGYVFVDGRGVGDIGRAVIRDREILAAEGFLTIFISVDGRGNLLQAPDIVSRGFVFLREADTLLDTIKDTVRQALKKNVNGRREEVIEESVGRLIFQETKRRPMIFARIHTVGR